MEDWDHSDYSSLKISWNTKKYSEKLMRPLELLFVLLVTTDVRTRKVYNIVVIDIFVDFTKAFDSIHREKMEQILQAYGIPKETVAAILLLYRNIKVKVRSPDGDTDYFDILAGVLQEDALAPFLFIIHLDSVFRTSIDKIKRKRFRADKEKKQKVLRKNNYRRRLRQRHSDSGKCTRPSRNTTALSETRRRWYWPPCQCSQNWIRVL